MPPPAPSAPGTWPSRGQRPDDALAGELVAVANQGRARRGFAAASAALDRSAVLTTDPGGAAERLADAVTDAFLAGDVSFRLA